MPNYDHLVLRPSNALLRLIKEPRNSEMQDFVLRATSTNHVLCATLDLKTAKLEKKNAEVNHLLDKNKDYVRKRTDTRLDSLAYELANVKKAADEEKMRLTAIIQDAELKISISKSINFASEQRIVTLKSEVDALEAKMIRLEEENRRLQTECIRHAELRIDNDRLQTEHVVLQCKHEELQEKCRFLESTSTLRAEQQMGHLKSENLVLKMEYETLKTENLNLNTETDLLKKENESLNHQCKIKRLNQMEYETFKTQNLNLKTEIDRLKKENESLKLQNEITDVNLRESKTLVSQQREDLKSLRMRVQALEGEIKDKSEQMYKEGVSLETVLSNNNLRSILCPITMDLMTDPVIAEDKHMYSRAGFETLTTGHGPFKSPLTRESISKNVYPNIALKNLIEELERFLPRVGAKTGESV
jgi:chromosome segregation ATPase